MNNKFTHFLLICSLVVLCACTKQVATPALSPEQELENNTAAADGIWQNYLKSSEQGIAPFRTQMSLRYGSEGNTRRVTALLWGNNAHEIRLDVNAGVGVNIAKIYENKNIFIIYSPREESAYYHQGTQKPLFNAGVPIPFNLLQLTQLIEGKYSEVFGRDYTGEVELARDDNSDNPARTFNITHPTLMGKLTINYQGLPLFWQEMNSQGWSMKMSYREDSKIPYKLSVSHESNSKMVILLIKNREYSLSPFTEAQMQLILPDDTMMQPLVEAQKLK